MFCPKCGIDNADGSKFCRACGVNISLVPQALSGQLPQEKKKDDDDDWTDWDWMGLATTVSHIKRASVTRGMSRAFMGLAFLVVSIILSMTPMGWSWWYWMLIPAFAMLGRGIGEIWQAKSEEKKALTQPKTSEQRSFQPTQKVNSLPRLNTTEFMDAPPSITENTTKHLGAEMPTKVFDERN